MWVLWEDNFIVGQVEGFDKAVAELVHEVEGPTQKGNVPTNLMPSSQTGNRLVDHGLKDTGRNIFLPGPVIDQWLDISLGKDPAPTGNRVNFFRVPSQLVQPIGIGIQEDRHLVNKGSGPTGTTPVHPLFQRVAKEGDFGILTPPA